MRGRARVIIDAEVVMPRLFTGVEIPPTSARRSSLLRGGLPGARWIDRENYHVTLRFIGDVDDCDRAGGGASCWPRPARRFELHLDGLTSFGGSKPRAVVATVAPTQALLELQAEQERLMQRIGLEPEGRKYTPHVTLARLRDSSSRDVAEYLSARGCFRTAPFPCRAFRAVLVARLDRRRALCGRERAIPLGCDARRAAEQPRLCVEDRGGDAVTVGHRLAHQRQGRRARRIDFADHAAEIERQLGVEFARQLLHAPVIGEAIHVQDA